jgi:threonine/homoserine/homoserine lactone efflux protein
VQSVKIIIENATFLLTVDIITFIATVVAVTASGALAPGPLFLTNITHGTRSGAKGGLAFSVGHTIFELGLVVFLAVTLHAVISQLSAIELIVGVIGGSALLAFGFLQIREALSKKTAVESKSRFSSKTPLFLGAFFTGLNPYFIIWWLTVGLTLIVNALEIASFLGVIVMYIAHVWMDYVWLIGTAYLAKKGTDLTGRKGYRILMIVLGLILVYFGVNFVISPLL